MTSLRLTGRGRWAAGCGAVLTLAGGATGHPAALAGGLFALACLTAACALVLVRARGASLSRTGAAPRASVDSEITAAAVIAWRRRGSAPAVLRGLIPEWGASLRPDGNGPLGVHLRPGRHVVRQSLVPLHRGAHRWPGPRLELPDPLGMAYGVVAAPDSGYTVVYPRCAALPATAVPTAPAGAGRADSAVRYTFGADTASDPMPRAHQPGDERRRMHWPATARTGELMVRTYESGTVRTAAVLVDTAAETYRSTESFERAIEAAASMSCHLLAHDWLVSLRSAEGRCLTSNEWLSGPDGGHQALAALAVLEPGANGAGPAASGAQPDAVLFVHGLGAPPAWASAGLCVEDPPVGAPAAAARIVWNGERPLAACWLDAVVAVPAGRRA